MQCANCQYADIPSDEEFCPKCGSPLHKIASPIESSLSSDSKNDSLPAIHASVQVGEMHGGQVAGVRIEQMGYSAEQVQALISQINSQFEPRPFSGECPFVGLRNFKETDADLFFGRERLVAEMIEPLRNQRFLVIAGPSGCGKSSIARAGLLSALKRGAFPGSKNWLYSSFTPGAAPLESLGRAIAGLSGSLNPFSEIKSANLETPGLLSQWLEVLLGEDNTRRAILLVDQFEEIFTQLNIQDEFIRQVFLDQLIYAVTNESGRAKVILTLRSDYIANFSTYSTFNTLLNKGFFQIGDMSAEELASTMLRPALRTGLQVDPALVTQVIADMRDQPGALPLMQFALTDLFQTQITQEKGKAITLDGYLARGGLSQALERYADACYDALAQRQKILAQKIFRTLVVPGIGHHDSARTANFDELDFAGTNQVEIEAVIKELADARLLITGEEDGHGRTIRLAHERLLEAWPWLKRLVDINRQAIALQQEIQQDASRWHKNGEDTSYLYRGARLVTAQEQLNEQLLSLSGQAERFIAASTAYQEAQIKAELDAREAEQRRELEAAQKLAETQRQAAVRLRRRAIILGAVLLIAIGLLIWALQAQNQATNALDLSNDRGTQVAEKALIATNAQGQAEFMAATAIANANNARAGELAAFSLVNKDTQPDIALLLGIEALNSADTLQSRNALFTALQTYPYLGRLFYGGRGLYIDYFEFSPDGKYIAASNDAGQITLWDTQGGLLQQWETDLSVASSFGWGADGSLYLAASTGMCDSTCSGVSNCTKVCPEWQFLRLSPGNLQPEVILPNLHLSREVLVKISRDGRKLAYNGCAQTGSAPTATPFLTGTQYIQPTQGASGLPPTNSTPTLIPTSGLMVTRTPTPFRFMNSASTPQTTICQKGQVTFIELPNGQRIGTFAVHAGEPFLFNFLADGRLLSMGRAEREMSPYLEEAALLDSDQGVISPVTLPEGLNTGGGRILLDSTGPQVGTFVNNKSGTNYLVVWDLQTEQELLRANLAWLGVYDLQSYKIVLRQNGKRAALVYGGQDILLFDIGGEVLNNSIKLTAPPWVILRFALNPDGSAFAATRTGYASLVGPKESLFYGRTTFPALATPMAVSLNDEQTLIAGNTRDDISYINEKPYYLGAANPSMPVYVTFGCNLSGGSDCDSSQVTFWDTQTMQPVKTIAPAQRAQILTAAFSLDGTWLATGDASGQVVVWDARRMEPKGIISNSLSTDAVLSIAFSPDGRFLAQGSMDVSDLMNLNIWHLPDLTPVELPEIPQLNVGVTFSLSFSPDSKRLAFVNRGESTTVLFLDTTTWQVEKSIQMDIDVSGVTFSPEGSQFVTVGMGFVLQYWDCETLAPVSSTNLPLDLSAQTTKYGYLPTEFTYSPDMQTMAIGLGDSIVLMDIASRQIIGVIHEVDGLGIGFSQDGKRLYTPGKVWDLDPKQWVKAACQIAGRNLDILEWGTYFPGDIYRKTCSQ